jgi:Bacteriophage HK97-gp10, putative tail-component
VVADGVDYTIHGIPELDAALTAMAARVETATRAAVIEAAHVAQRASMEEAPVVTGTLRRSIITEGPISVAGGASAQVGPSVIYGRRVELGFFGSDSLGRSYSQAGNPYMERGLAAIQDQLTGIFEAAWGAALGV